MTRPTIQPSRLLAETCAALGMDCVMLWRMRGPDDTAVAWLACYDVVGRLVIVETMKDGRIVILQDNRWPAARHLESLGPGRRQAAPNGECRSDSP